MVTDYTVKQSSLWSEARQLFNAHPTLHSRLAKEGKNNTGIIGKAARGGKVSRMYYLSWNFFIHKAVNLWSQKRTLGFLNNHTLVYTTELWVWRCVCLPQAISLHLSHLRLRRKKNRVFLLSVYVRVVLWALCVWSLPCSSSWTLHLSFLILPLCVCLSREGAPQWVRALAGLAEDHQGSVSCTLDGLITAWNSSFRKSNGLFSAMGRYQAWYKRALTFTHKMKINLLAKWWYSVSNLDLSDFIDFVLNYYMQQNQMRMQLACVIYF